MGTSGGEQCERDGGDQNRIDDGAAAVGGAARCARRRDVRVGPDRRNARPAGAVSTNVAAVRRDRICRGGRGHHGRNGRCRRGGRNEAPHTRVCETADDMAEVGAQRAMDRRDGSRSVRRRDAARKGNELNKTSILLIAAIALASCAPAPAPVVAPVAPQGNVRYLIDPRTGYDAQPTVANAKRFDDAWRAILSGDYTTARKKLDDIRAKEPNYAPLQLAEAAIDLRQGKTDAARPIVERALAKRPHYTAAEVYAAEIAITEKRTREAFDIYRDVASRPNAPDFVTERIGEL